MKTQFAIGVIVIFLCGTLLGLAGGQDKPDQKAGQPKTKPEAKAATQPAEAAPPLNLSLQPKAPLYDAGGRRDPFRDLLGGSQTKERSAAEGPELSIEDLRLIGIVRYKGKIFGLVTGPQGFPYKIKEGDKFSDGYVLKVTQDAVTFRQTSEKGMRLISPRDIVKELNPEER